MTDSSKKPRSRHRVQRPDPRDQDHVSGETLMRQQAGIPTPAEIHQWFIENTPPELYTDADRRRALGGWHSAIPDRLIAALPNLVREYVFDNSIAMVAGVPESTWDKWKRRGREDHEAGNDTQESRFYRVLVSSLAEMERTELYYVRSMTPGWQARAWVLERRFPQRWGRRTAGASVNDEEVKKKLTNFATKHELDPSELLEEMEALRASWDQ